MDKIYESRLRATLDELYLKSATIIPWVDIYMWFGIKKIAKAPYRHLQKEWTELCELHQRVWPARTTPPKLHMLESDGSVGLVLRRELFADESNSLVDFEQLIA